MSQESTNTFSLTLSQWQRRFPDGKVPTEQALEVISQLMDDLHRAHIESPFHRDVIPSTILVSERDDGTSRFTVPDLATVAENHGEKGARRYLSPEQWWGGRQNTYTDQYALAVLFVELVTGRVPFLRAFETDDETVMRTAVCNHPVKLDADCPRREALLRALSKDPRQRFHSCSSFVAALMERESHHSHANEESSSVNDHHRHEEHREPRVRKPTKPKSRGSWFWRVLLIVLLIWGGFWVQRSGWLDRFLKQLPANAQPGDAENRQRQQAAEAAEKLREVRLGQIQAEIVRQRKASDQALADLRSFLEQGGCALIEVRRDTLRQELKRVTDDRNTVTSQLETERRLTQALNGIAGRVVPFGAVASDIPAESAVAKLYKDLSDASQKLDDLKARFTDQHPEVKTQTTIVQESVKRFFDAVASAQRHAQTSLSVKESRLDKLNAAEKRLNDELGKLERDWQVAKSRQDELERARDHESQRLADLMQKEMDMRFGGVSTRRPAATNSVAR